MTNPTAAVRVLMMAGGTGGHVFPALAVANELRERGCEVQWMGTRRGIEARLVPANGFEIHYMNVAGLRGKSKADLFLAPIKLLKAILFVRNILKQYQPQVVVGMGGYASGPGGIAAWSAGLPLVIHEQNARAGTTNKILSRFAQQVLTAFPGVLPKGRCIGNPVRDDIARLAPPEERFAGRSGPLRLLVLGGSLGAQAINEIMPQTVQSMVDAGRLIVKHQAGETHWQATQENYARHQIVAEVQPFIEDMAAALAWADLVVCRAGALTVTEVSAAGVASVLVPFPFAIDDHQTANAEWLVSNGGAELRQQKALTVENLQELIMSFIDDREKCLHMAKAARAVAKPSATRDCADICMEATL